MKPKLLTGCLLVSLALAACGGDEPGRESGRSETTTAIPEIPKGAPAPPRVRIPSGGSPPKKVIVRELRRGRGARLQRGRGATANYVTFAYKTGKPTDDRWGDETFHWIVGAGGASRGWEIGVRAMRVGGQRMLLVPSNLAFFTGAQVFLVELLDVE